MMPNSMSAQLRIRGGWLLERIASMPVHDEGDLSEAISSLCSTRTFVVNFDFIAPRYLNKRIIRIDARKELGVASWGKNNEVTGLNPNSVATKTKIRVGWILLAINGESLSGNSSPSAVLTEIRLRANDRTDPLSHTAAARHAELTFNAASDDVKQVRLDPRNPGITWKPPRERGRGNDPHQGEIVVEGVEDGQHFPKRGWRLIKINANENECAPQSRNALSAMLEAAAKAGRNEVMATFDCSDEEPDVEEASRIQADTALAETQISPIDIPELPVVESSIYLHVVGGSDFQLGGRALHVRFDAYFTRRCKYCQIQLPRRCACTGVEGRWGAQNPQVWTNTGNLSGLGGRRPSCSPCRKASRRLGLLTLPGLQKRSIP